MKPYMRSRSAGTVVICSGLSNRDTMAIMKCIIDITTTDDPNRSKSEEHSYPIKFSLAVSRVALMRLRGRSYSSPAISNSRSMLHCSVSLALSSISASRSGRRGAWCVCRCCSCNSWWMEYDKYDSRLLSISAYGEERWYAYIHKELYCDRALTNIVCVINWETGHKVSGL